VDGTNFKPPGAEKIALQGRWVGAQIGLFAQVGTGAF
jgi:hypothetical protein